jgi:ferredoxin
VTLYCVTTTATAFTASYTSFHILFADPSISPLLVDRDCDASEQPRPRLLINHNRLVHCDRCATFTVPHSHCIPLCPVTLLYSSPAHSRKGQAWDSKTLANNCTLSHLLPSHVIVSLRFGVEVRFLSRARLGVSAARCLNVATTVCQIVA